MNIYRKPHAPGGALAIFIACFLYLPSVSAGVFSGTEWKVTSGDTLYAIGRAVYPGDAPKQARLRRDIMKLNPSIFVNGANNMDVGDVLKLPDYVAPKSAPSKAGKSAPAPITDKVTPQPELPSVSTGVIRGNEWKVTRGDTLYKICRTIYPEDARKQARLGRDIKKLNPSVFDNGANNMNVGVVLKLPDYVALKSIPSKVGEPVPAPMPDKVTPQPTPPPIPDKVTPEPALQSVAPAPVVEPQPERPTVKEQPASSLSRAEGGVVVSLGFSYGGDRLVNVGGGPDISAGNGVQLRLGYEQMFLQGSGYRASLGLQYYTLLEQRDVSFRDAYLQLAYQYRVNPVVYGIGVVIDTGARLENNTTTEYDPAIGAVAYLEYVGSGKLAGWGISVTSLGIEEKNSGTSFDASRAELYYRWRF